MLGRFFRVRSRRAFYANLEFGVIAAKETFHLSRVDLNQILWSKSELHWSLFLILIFLVKELNEHW